MGPGMGRMGGMGQPGGMGAMQMQMANADDAGRCRAAGGSGSLGLKPDRHIAGFSIRKEDGTAIPLIFEAAVGRARDTVVLKLSGPVPAKSFLWYGHGYDPDCNLTDGADMAVPVFGPISLDDVPEFKPPAMAMTGAAMAVRPMTASQRAGSGLGTEARRAASGRPSARPDQAPDHHRRPRPRLEGDHASAQGDPLEGRTDLRRRHHHAGQGPDRREPGEVRRSPAQLQGHAQRRTGDEMVRREQGGVPEGREREGKGLVVFHFASSAFPKWDEFGKAIAGGWRSQGFHGPKHVYTVKKTAVKHPISDGLPAEFTHTIDELYQNSVMEPGNEVLATAYSDPKKPRGTGKDEPIIWVNTYGKGRVYNNALGHDVEAMTDPNFRDLDAPRGDLGGRQVTFRARRPARPRVRGCFPGPSTSTR